MDRILSILAISALTTTAVAQNYILRLEGGPSQVDTSAGAVSFTIDVIGDAEAGLGTHMLWGNFSLETSGAKVEGITWMHAGWSEFNHHSEYGGDGNMSNIEFGQWEWADFVPRAGSELGQQIGSFQITLAQSGIGAGEFRMSLVPSISFGLSTIDVDSGASYYSTPEDLILEGFSIQLVPTPGTAGLLLGSWLLGAGRRR